MLPNINIPAKALLSEDKFSEAIARIPAEIMNMSKEDLAITVWGVICKMDIIQMSRDHSEPFYHKHIQENNEIPNLARMCAGLEDYSMLAYLHDINSMFASMKSKMENTGSVYVISFPGDVIKIGKSISPQLRVKSVSGGHSEKMIEFWCSESFHGFSEVEKYAHKYFSDQRKNGEYFNADFNQAIDVIKEKILQTSK